MVLGFVALLWLFGSPRGLLGMVVGGFVGTFAAAGLVGATTGAELADMYTPAGLAAGVGPLAIVALGAAVVLPYATGIVALAWTAGAALAAFAAVETGQAAYVIPLLLHVAVAGAVVRVATRRMVWD